MPVRRPLLDLPRPLHTGRAERRAESANGGQAPTHAPLVRDAESTDGGQAPPAPTAPNPAIGTASACQSRGPLVFGRRMALALFGTGPCLIGTNALADDAGPTFRIIVHPDNPSTGESRTFLSDAFLKKVTQWRDGHTIKPVDQHHRSAVREDFSKRVLRRSVAAIREYWQQRIFSGRGVPPPELPSDEAVVDYVLRNRGAVGYVRADTNLRGARVLQVY